MSGGGEEGRRGGGRRTLNPNPKPYTLNPRGEEDHVSQTVKWLLRSTRPGQTRLPTGGQAKRPKGGSPQSQEAPPAQRSKKLGHERRGPNGKEQNNPGAMSLKDEDPCEL